MKILQISVFFSSDCYVAFGNMIGFLDFQKIIWSAIFWGFLRAPFPAVLSSGEGGLSRGLASPTILPSN